MAGPGVKAALLQSSTASAASLLQWTVGVLARVQHADSCLTGNSQQTHWRAPWSSGLSPTRFATAPKRGMTREPAAPNPVFNTEAGVAPPGPPASCLQSTQQQWHCCRLLSEAKAADRAMNRPPSFDMWGRQQQQHGVPASALPGVCCSTAGLATSLLLPHCSQYGCSRPGKQLSAPLSRFWRCKGVAHLTKAPWGLRDIFWVELFK